MRSVCLLDYLCGEVMESEEIRDVLDGDEEEHSKLIKEFEENEKGRQQKHNAIEKQKKLEERQQLAGERSKINEAKALAKQEREAKQREEVAKFNEWLVGTKQLQAMEATDPNFKVEWKNWKTWQKNEKLRQMKAENAAKRKAELDRVAAEKKHAQVTALPP